MTEDMTMAAEETLGGGGCSCCSLDGLPPTNPEHWPQAPLLLRPNPKSGTKVIGIRKENTADYLWTPGSSTTWWKALQQEWGTSKEEEEEDAKMDLPLPRPCCQHCAILPINNGNEAPGESIVTDVETELFRGTFLLRLRHSEGTTREPSDDTTGAFAGVPFRYEVVMRGKFQKELPLTEMTVGMRYSRPFGTLPPSWVTWAAKKLFGFLAPQVQLELAVDQPFILSPLGSFPRSFEVDDTPPSDFLGDPRAEPTTAERSITGQAYDIEDPIERAKARKKYFDQLVTAKDTTTLMTDPNKTYTLKSVQHLVDYQTLCLDLGGSISMDLNKLLDGQPLQFMASHDDQTLFSFEIWNASLMEDALKHSSATAAQISG